MASTTLIDTATVEAHLHDPAFAMVDCRYDLNDQSWGQRAYLDTHVPGSVYASLDRDLAGGTTGHNGRHPLPDPGTLAATLKRSVSVEEERPTV